MRVLHSSHIGEIHFCSTRNTEVKVVPWLGYSLVHEKKLFVWFAKTDTAKLQCWLCLASCICWAKADDREAISSRQMELNCENRRAKQWREKKVRSYVGVWVESGRRSKAWRDGRNAAVKERKERMGRQFVGPHVYLYYIYIPSMVTLMDFFL